ALLEEMPAEPADESESRRRAWLDEQQATGRRPPRRRRHLGRLGGIELAECIAGGDEIGRRHFVSHVTELPPPRPELAGGKLLAELDEGCVVIAQQDAVQAGPDGGRRPGGRARAGS